MNNNEDFKWTDELVKEYVHRTFAPCDPNHQFVQERMAEFKKEKQSAPIMKEQEAIDIMRSGFNALRLEVDSTIVDSLVNMFNQVLESQLSDRKQSDKKQFAPIIEREFTDEGFYHKQEPVKLPLSAEDAIDYFEKNKRTFDGMYAGEYLTKDDFLVYTATPSLECVELDMHWQKVYDLAIKQITELKKSKQQEGFSEKDVKAFAGYYYKTENEHPEFSLNDIFKEWMIKRITYERKGFKQWPK